MPQCDHPIQRARERYGLELTGVDLRKIAMMIQRNQGTLDRTHEWSVGPQVSTTVWFVEYMGKKLRVVMSADFYKVITFIPLEDHWRGKQPPKEKKKRRKKVYVNGRPRYVEIAA